MKNPPSLKTISPCSTCDLYKDCADAGILFRSDLEVAVRQTARLAAEMSNLAMQVYPNERVKKITRQLDVDEYTPQVWACARSQILGECMMVETVITNPEYI